MNEMVKGNKFYDATLILFNLCKKYNKPLKSDSEWAEFRAETEKVAKSAGENSFVWDLVIALVNEKVREQTHE